jgi:hypothetical protein
MSLRQMILVGAGVALLGTAATAPAQVGKTITEPGQALTNSEGTWSLSKDGETEAGYAVRRNGKDVGYAVSLTVAKNGYPVATHKNGTQWEWTGWTLKAIKK